MPSFQGKKRSVDLMPRLCLRAVNGSPAPKPLLEMFTGKVKSTPLIAARESQNLIRKLMKRRHQLPRLNKEKSLRKRYVRTDNSPSCPWLLLEVYGMLCRCERSDALRQNAEPTARAASASERTDGGKDATPQDVTRRQARPSTKTSWAKLRQRSKRN